MCPEKEEGYVEEEEEKGLKEVNFKAEKDDLDSFLVVISLMALVAIEGDERESWKLGEGGKRVKWNV